MGSRSVVLVVLLTIVIGACGGSDASPGSTSSTTVADTAATTTTAAATTTTAAATTTTAAATTTTAAATTTTAAATTTVQPTANVSVVAPSFGDGAELSVKLPDEWLPLVPGDAEEREMWESVNVIGEDAFLFRVFAEDISSATTDLLSYSRESLATNLAGLTDAEVLDSGSITIDGRDATLSFISTPVPAGVAVVASAYILVGDVAWELTFISIQEPEAAAGQMGSLMATVSITP